MASVRKKLDEKNLKVLRELVSLPENKHCFDCHQRGPTYVNVTIGSFVCTTCSGMLRGLTPPHRVKSISMATFTLDEIDLLRSRGNGYCRKVWLGLYEGDQMFKEEQQIKEYMIAKYEKKRYYVKASETDKVSNGTTPISTTQSVPKLPTSSFTFPAPSSNNNMNRNHNNNFFVPQTLIKTKEVPKIPTQDPFSSSNNISISSSTLPVDNFANFENNPIFTTPQISQMSASVPTLDNKAQGPTPPSEDRYAALKDLDSLMKSQQSSQQAENIPAASTSEWDPGNVWSVPGNSHPNQLTSNGMFETNPTLLSAPNTKDLNPFSTNNADAAWGNAFGGNPFNADFSWSTANGTANGLQASQSFNNFNSPKPFWNTNFGVTPNPFTISSNGQSVSHHSSNPFL